MNNELFNQAHGLYDAKNYEAALNSYVACLQDASNPLGVGEMGRIYHQMGNCYIKLKQCPEAIQCYTQATADSAYDACGAVNCNLGMAYAAMRDFESAVRHFEIAVSDAKYDTPYKAYNGMGNALMKLGRSAEAGVAFRSAAIDETNPEPTKALLNLGVCFMALDRPADAAQTYESALQFECTGDTKNRLYASLGQAYVACNQMQKAVNAFEQATADQTYFLSDSATVDYKRAIAELAQGAASMTQVLPQPADTSGLDVSYEGGPVYSDETEMYPYADQSPYGQAPLAENEGALQQGDLENDRFFAATEQEIMEWSKGEAKKSRKRKNIGLKILIVIIILIILAFGAAVFGYTQGYGYPSQDAVAQKLFADPEAAKGEVFADGLSEETVNSMMSAVIKDPGATVDGVNKSMSESTAYVTATTEQGGKVTYRVSMVRDMLGWKISSVELCFPSQN